MSSISGHCVLLHFLRQVVPDPKFQQQGSSSSRLTFFLDGAHTPESMITCGTWFAQVAPAAAANNQQQQQQQQVVRVLVFNCMKERDPAVLLPHLHSELQQHESAVHLALFVPPDSQYAFLPSSSTQQLVAEAHQDLSWQQQLRGVWQQCQEAAAASSEQQLAEGRGLLPPLPEVSGAWLLVAHVCKNNVHVCTTSLHAAGTLLVAYVSTKIWHVAGLRTATCMPQHQKETPTHLHVSSSNNSHTLVSCQQQTAHPRLHRSAPCLSTKQ